MRASFLQGRRLSARPPARAAAHDQAPCRGDRLRAWPCKQAHVGAMLARPLGQGQPAVVRSAAARTGATTMAH
ncbi:hypothetical protein BHM03_00048157 [Ensete ventricosum]|nr:hypothetical protein BHM03_00048157 [Ensete ventricosum]